MQKRYWLRWGLKFALVDLIVNIILVIASVYAPNDFSIGSSAETYYNFMHFFGVTFVLPGMLSAPLFLGFLYVPKIGSLLFYVIRIVISVLAYFLVGGIIGWIYGKFKNRNVVR